MSLIRTKSGFLSPTSINKHPIISAFVRLLLPLMPIAFEYLEDYLRREKARRAYEQEAARPMHKPLTFEEAYDVLAIDVKANDSKTIPLQINSEARKTAERNFKKFFAMCQPEIAELNKEFFFPNSNNSSNTSNTANETERKGTEKKASSSTAIGKNDYLAGKFSGAYRLLVDANWDQNLKFPQQEQQEQQQNSNGKDDDQQQYNNNNNSSGPI